MILLEKEIQCYSDHSRVGCPQIVKITSIPVAAV